MSKKAKIYTISIIIPLLAGGLSALLTMNNMDIYSRIVPPPLAPPAILFPVVWSVLYILMGISSGLVYINKHISPENAQTGLIVYGLNLVLNFFWSLIFFNLQEYLFAFFWIIAMWVTIIMMIYYYSKVNKTAAYLQIPYLVWTTFASYLTFMIYLLN